MQYINAYRMDNKSVQDSTTSFAIIRWVSQHMHDLIDVYVILHIPPRTWHTFFILRNRWRASQGLFLDPLLHCRQPSGFTNSIFEWIIRWRDCSCSGDENALMLNVHGIDTPAKLVAECSWMEASSIIHFTMLKNSRLQLARSRRQCPTPHYWTLPYHCHSALLLSYVYLRYKHFARCHTY